MKATWRPLPAWPYPPVPKQSGTFQVGWDQTLDDLAEEIERLKGSDVLIGVVFADDTQYRLDGAPKAGFKVKHPGVEISFDVPGSRRLTFHTDAYRSLQFNLRAIGLGLAALRAVDRYGITNTAEQYAGFQQLTAGGASPERGAMLVEAAGGLTAALKKHHPDHGGAAIDFQDVQAYRKRAGF